jgi:hypothetical protein
MTSQILGNFTFNYGIIQHPYTRRDLPLCVYLEVAKLYKLHMLYYVTRRSNYEWRILEDMEGKKKMLVYFTRLHEHVLI